ncbi:hypothetical protein KR76_00071 [Pimelobacter simplex]|uniref:Uncharacterized protein n=1 Tax=Nocardioides simplex TaxID=2045 RepID=A0A0C5WY74_NOCSI|nr:hypothetical protein KR76_00071 [Pimelobacter simplex]
MLRGRSGEDHEGRHERAGQDSGPPARDRSVPRSPQPHDEHLRAQAPQNATKTPEISAITGVSR